jgi:hypothetical protein
MVLTNQRHAALQFGANLGDRIEYIAQAVEVGRAQCLHRRLVAQGALELRPFAVGEIQAEAHRVGHRQDVGEQDGGVQRVARQRLQRDFGRVIRVLRKAQERTGAGAGGAVFGQVAASLAHQPEWCVIGRLAQQRAQESVVLECGEGSGHRPGREFREAAIIA